MDPISALMDGELDEHQALREIARAREDGELLERWETFHVIGDALRGEMLLSSGFTSAVCARLTQEPTVLAPRRVTRQGRRFTTYALSAAASLCAAGFVAWVALAPTAPGGIQARATADSAVAIAPAALQPAPEITSVSSEGRMNEYLLAHQGFSPSTAIQGLAPYIRSVSANRNAERTPRP